ncbi:MAG: membrane dipeptidase, partial [Clostridia bacterium]|nr:membrane dipeptidase [Clostridia bacterium]
ADCDATLDDILLHIDYLLEKGAEKVLCIGADMDGGEMPSQIPSLSHLPILTEELQKRNFSDLLIQSIFFENAYRFARRYINL